jgi:hypothetical protein
LLLLGKYINAVKQYIETEPSKQLTVKQPVCKEKNMESEISPAQTLIISLIVLFCGISNAAIVGRILKQNWKELRPFHVYQMNYFSGISLVSLVGLLVLAGDKISYRGFCPAILLSYFFSINNIYDIVILQLDRLTAVGKPLYYRSRVHAALALKIVISAKVFTVIITSIASIIDPVFLHCPVCSRCIYVHSINVYTVAYPSLAAILLTLIVSIFVSIKANRLNSIQPLVVMPLSKNVENENPKRTPTIWTTSDFSKPSTSRQVDIEYFEKDESFDEETVEVKSEEAINIASMIHQLDQKISPKRIQPTPSNDRPQTTRNSQVIQLEKAMMKKTLKMNLLTLALLFIVVPIQVLTIAYENCDNSKGECENYFSSMIVISVLQLVIGCLHPIVVIIILELNS